MYKYTNLTFTELVNKIGGARYWNLPTMLKEILSRLSGSIFNDAPSDGEQYARQDGEWEIVASSSGGVNTVSGDFVDNTDPLNPVLNRGYKVYTALLTQSGTSAPVATVLENTLGDIVFSYESPGIYVGTLNGVFINNKSGFLVGHSGVNSHSLIKSYYNTLDDFYIETSIAGGSGTNGLLNNTFIEIRVYN